MTIDTSENPVESNGSNAQPDRLLRFPPFPRPPEGVQIIPFKDFKERGIQIFTSGDHEVELDGLGIPTIQMSNRHENDVCKSGVKRKYTHAASSKKGSKNKKHTSNGDSTFRKEWWEVWEEREISRNTNTYDPNMGPIERLSQAAYDFRVNRTWPTGETLVRTVWDEFCLFLGVSDTATQSSDRPPTHIQPEDMSDEEDEEDMFEANVSVDPSTNVPPDLVEEPDYGANTETKEFMDKAYAASVARDEKALAFLNNPEKQTKKLLSSHMRKRGLIWSDRNLVSGPRLMMFFIEFLLRNNIFPEASNQRRFRQTLAVAEIALKELPLTSSLAKALPDELSYGAKECWGSRTEGLKRLPIDEPQSEVDTSTEEPNAKRPKLDESSPVEKPAQPLQENLSSPSQDVKMGAPEESNTWGGHAETWGSTVDTGDTNAETWGSGGGGSSWGTDLSAQPISDASPWDAPAPVWDDGGRSFLMKLLGPTVLPLTHIPGVVEWSVRRIKSVTLPSVINNKPPTAGSEDWAMDPELVEGDLEKRFARVVLEPWLDWDVSEDPLESKPRILDSSEGAVVIDGVVHGGSDEVAAGGKEAAESPHDPIKDDIVLLVQPIVVESISVGMGMGGTWVQLVRKPGVKVPKRKSKSKTKKAEKYWYVNELIMILPSYYSV